MCGVFQPVAQKAGIEQGGDWVRWRGDGGEMFYIAADGKVMSVAVQASAGSLELGTPQALFMIPVALATSGTIAPYTYDVRPVRAAISGGGASR
jgi:hypothetical protein